MFHTANATAYTMNHIKTLTLLSGHMSVQTLCGHQIRMDLIVTPYLHVYSVDESFR